MAAVFAACGGGGATPSAATPPPGGGGGPSRPDIVLFVVSGHDWSGGVDPAYLVADAGPEIEDDLTAHGLDVVTVYYVDDAYPVAGYGGYYELVADMEYVRDNWAPLGARSVVVAHSHGGVWAHAAVRDVPGLAIRCLVDLDCSSYGWDTVGHDDQNYAIGWDPRSQYEVGYYVTPGAYPSVPREATGVYDLEDTVFPNVTYDLDVRSGDSFLLFGEWFDEAWNIRRDGTTTGLYYYFADTSHTGVHAAGSSTLATVRGWLRARLGV